MRNVRVYAVNIPAWSTIGRLVGFDDDTGEVVRFSADHRPARQIGEVLEQATDDDDLPLCAVEDWQVLEVVPA